jgi:hypothetical protein
MRPGLTAESNVSNGKKPKAITARDRVVLLDKDSFKEPEQIRLKSEISQLRQSPRMAATRLPSRNDSW